MPLARPVSRPLAALAAGVLVALAGCGTGGGVEPAPSPSAAGPAPSADTAALAPGEIAASPNMELLANAPKPEPFDTEEAFGTDMAFQGDRVFVGNEMGLLVYDIADPAAPELLSQVVCPGGQGDVTIAGDLLFYSVDYMMADSECGADYASEGDPEPWEGIRVFDVSDPTDPRYVSDVRTDCGSHTNTLVPGGPDSGSAYIYVSSYDPYPGQPGCEPPHNKISVVEIPLDDPESASVVAEPELFDADSESTGCHDITVFPELELAAGACMGDGLLLDISEPLEPVVIDRVRDEENFAFWHSATFNNDGTKIVFTDELGGGMAPTCDAATGPTRGANGIYEITGEGADARLSFQAYYKIPRMQSRMANCVAHNGSLIPVEGRDIMVQAWYQGGVSVWDFTDSTAPVEIGYWQRGPFSAERLVTGGSWSAYYYNGHIYSSDIQEGLDVLAISDPVTDPAADVVFPEDYNPQDQPVY
ncbi:LVIVD repeat-containing protein [Allonocardiopsis opalescens]|uniref:LVIVD repeat-containing protein n=1 Tax=Allonocardiopsis opalescens TaxID=1144618 RepID=A0A2T0PVG4_9ACTN|nr:hypothetical protein [Allonocardiopsis opalescens]PRX95519.1 LVIVD repeat-containing protein [Allonocardiopsis opalescens]